MQINVNNYLQNITNNFKYLEYSFFTENIHYKINSNAFKNINISKYFFIYKFYYKLFFKQYYNYNNIISRTIYKEQFETLGSTINNFNENTIDTTFEKQQYTNKLIMKLLLDIFSSLYNFTTWFESCSQLLNTKMKSVIAENLLSEGFLNEQFKEEQFTMEEIESSFSVEKSFYFYLNNCYLLFILFKVNNLDRPIFKKSTNKDELYVFFEKAYSSSEVKSEYKIFIYPNDFTEIMDYINYLFLKDGCLNYTKFLENEFQLTKNGKIDKEYWHNGVMLKPYKNSLDIYSSTFIYLRERIKESIDEILKMESLQRYLQNNNLEKEFDINKYLSNFPMKKEVEYLYSNVDFTKLENICNKEEIERMKIIYSYFWINFNEKELQKKKLHKELYKNLNYLFGKYLNLITIFQYQIIATMSRKDYKNYSVHKVHHECCKTLFFIYEIYCLPIIKKLIIYRIENYLNKLMNDNDQLEYGNENCGRKFNAVKCS